MNTINFLPGTKVNQVGTINGLHFTDLFEVNYIIGENVLNEYDIKSKIINSKEVLYDRLFRLLHSNEKMFFKFLNKLMLATKNIPLINSLNSMLVSIKSELYHEDFDWECYSDYTSLEKQLKNFLFLYYTKKSK